MRRQSLRQNGRARNGPVPGLWLLSDARRLPDPRAAAGRLPPGSAVLARDLPPGLLRPLAKLARRRGLALVVAGDGRAALALARILAPALGAGLHLPDRRAVSGLLPFLAARRRGARGLLSVAAHGRAGLARARRLRADVVILSPVFPTESHPGAPALGPLRWAALARRAGRPVVALGGLDAGNSRRLPGLAAGWGAIGGLSSHTLLRASHSVSWKSRSIRLRMDAPEWAEP